MKLKLTFYSALAMLSQSVTAGVNITELSSDESLMFKRATQSLYSSTLNERHTASVKLVNIQLNSSKVSTIALENGEHKVYLEPQPKKQKQGQRIDAISSDAESIRVSVYKNQLTGSLELNGKTYEIRKAPQKSTFYLIEKKNILTRLKSDAGGGPLDLSPRLVGLEPCNLHLAQSSLNTAPKKQTRAINNCEPEPPIGGGGGGGTTKPAIKMMFVFANGAAARYNNNITAMEAAAINVVRDINSYFGTSQIADAVEVEYAGIYRWNYNEVYYKDMGERIGRILVAVPRKQFAIFASQDSGVQARRNVLKADVVAAVNYNPNDPTYDGYAPWIGASASNAYFAVDQTSLFNGMLTAHEFGHVVGLHHNIEESPALKPYRSGHGLLKPSIGKRTIMSYDCSPSCSTPVAIFANRFVNFPGTSTPSGEKDVGWCYDDSWPFVDTCHADSALVIENRALAVSKFR